jgi:hypothetical protein
MFMTTKDVQNYNCCYQSFVKMILQLQQQLLWLDSTCANDEEIEVNVI